MKNLLKKNDTNDTNDKTLLRLLVYAFIWTVNRLIYKDVVKILTYHKGNFFPNIVVFTAQLIYGDCVQMLLQCFLNHFQSRRLLTL